MNGPVVGPSAGDDSTRFGTLEATVLFDKFRRKDMPVTTWGGAFGRADNWESAVRQMSESQRNAWEHIIEKYWDPVEHKITLKGFDKEEAYDLTQGFFEWMMINNVVARADRNKGRFRDFLVKVLNDWLIDQHRRTKSKKRGGHTVHLPIDAAIDMRTIKGTIDEMTPEHALMFERWRALCSAADEAIEAHYEATGRKQVFEKLYRFLYRMPKEGEYDMIGTLILVEGRMLNRQRVARLVHDLREAWRAAIRAHARAHGAVGPEAERELADLEAWLTKARPGKG